MPIPNDNLPPDEWERFTRICSETGFEPDDFIVQVDLVPADQRRRIVVSREAVSQTYYGDWIHVFDQEIRGGYFA